MLTVPQKNSDTNSQTNMQPIYIPRMTQFFVHDSIESSCLICIQYCFDAFIVEVLVLLQVKHLL